MTVTLLLEELKQRGVELWVEADRLRFRAPQGALTAELREQLTARKSEVVAAVRDQAGAEVSGPLSWNQQSLYFLHQTAPQSPAYNVSFAVRLRSAVDTGAMRSAVRVLIDRHQILRTTYELRGGEPVQVVRAMPDLPFAVNDLTGAADAELTEAVQSASRVPFDLERGPVFRVTLFTVAPAEHVLLVCAHHVATDGWSLWILLAELRAFYAAHATDAPAALPRPELTYTDFVAAQQKALAGPEGERDWEYWRDQLRGDLSALEVPADRPRPVSMRYEGASIPFNWSGDLRDGIKRLAREGNTTLFAVLVAGFQSLLFRYTGRTEILLGTPVFGRSQAEFQSVVGTFVNSVVLRGDLSGARTFRQLLAETRSTLVDALAHGEYPFPLLVQKLGIPRDQSRSPIFQAMIVLQKPQRSSDLSALLTSGGQTVDFGGLRAEGFPLAQQEGQFDLTFEAAEADQSLLGAFKYNSAIFGAATIERMRSHFETFLRGVIAAPDTLISSVDLVSAAERQEHLSLWNPRSDAHAPSTCIHELVELQAARVPDRVAVTGDGRTLSYAQLNAKANRLAGYLRLHGVTADQLVGVSLERSVDMIVALLAILKAGGAYLPMDPAYPTDRKRFMASDGAAAVVITDASLAAEFDGLDLHVVSMDGIDSLIDSFPSTNLVSHSSPSNLAYVIYTSGSTGRPKGVLITHANVGRLFSSTEDWFHFDEHDVWTMFHSVAFDFSVWEIWGALLYGGRLVIVPYLSSRSPEAFHELLIQEGVTVLNQTPSAFKQLMAVDQPLPSQGALALRYVIFGGEALDLASLRPWIDKHGDDSPELINMYGITETTVHVTYRRIRDRDARSASASLIGVPIPDLQVYVLDDQQRLAPVGVPGEMYVGGAGVARGYLNRSELTAQRFIPDPFTADGEARLYRSGDLARRRADGDLEYLGRIDQQVKIRGFRIELGEIQQVLASHASVQDSAVIAHGSAGDTRLVAFVVPVAGSVVDHGALRRHIGDHLPDYMRPAAIVPVDRLPVTGNGKVDRAALGRAAQTALEHRHAPVRRSLPSTKTEETLMAIWSEVLGIGQVGPDDNFFDLGGHSLLATQLTSKVREQFQIDLPLRALFETNSLTQLAGVIDAARQGRASLAVAAVAPGDRQRPGEPHVAAPLRSAEPPLAGQAGEAAADAQAGAHRPSDPQPTPSPRPVQISPVEGTLTEIWADLLGLKTLARDDNFFDIGGQSLNGATLMQQVSEIFSIDMPLHTLFEAPTIATMSALIVDRLEAKRQARGLTATSVLHINTDGARPAFFFLHAAMQGEGFYCYNLARHLGEDQPLYALGPLGLDGSEVPPTIELMAAAQCEVIRRLQPRGPYYIGGFCLSGLVALEVARLLRAAGERVELLALIETRAFHPPVLMNRLVNVLAAAATWAARGSIQQQLSLAGRLRPLAYLVGPSFYGSRARSLRWAGRRLMAPFGFVRRLRQAGSPRAVPQTVNDPVSAEVTRANLVALDGYVPRPYDDTVVCMWAEAEPFEPRLWQSVASEVELRPVTGTHNTCITTQIQSLGLTLTAALRRAQENAAIARQSQAVVLRHPGPARKRAEPDAATPAAATVSSRRAAKASTP